MKHWILIAACWLTWSAHGSDVPLETLDGWQVLSYRSIEPNVVTPGRDGLRIDVNTSASPLVYPLPEQRTVSRVRVRARWTGALALPTGAEQGMPGADDAVLKLGLVQPGEQTLNWFQKRIAAKWVRTLFDLAPPGSGISGIHFLSTTQQAAQVGTSRIHPLSELLRETRLVHLAQPGAFELDVALPEPTDVIALWVAADGDDTGSRFSLVIESIELMP